MRVSICEVESLIKSPGLSNYVREVGVVRRALKQVQNMSQSSKFILLALRDEGDIK